MDVAESHGHSHSDDERGCESDLDLRTPSCYVRPLPLDKSRSELPLILSLIGSIFQLKVTACGKAQPQLQRKPSAT